MAPPLLTALDSVGHVHLIIGSNPLANARCSKSIEVGAKPKVVAPADAVVHYILAKRIEDGEVEWIKKSFEDADISTLGRSEIDNVVDAVFVTGNGKNVSSTHISSLCRRMRVPVNVVDSPNLCTFTLLSTHSDGPLQVGITTSGKGCKLASRIRREIASSLPPNLGTAVERLGTVRRRIWEEDHKTYETEEPATEVEDDDATAQRPTFNRLVSETDHNAARTRRMRWLSQICEYWPLRRLASITDADIDTILQSYTTSSDLVPSPLNATNTDIRSRPKPIIILAGSGPGNPSLLTMATHRAIQTASIILADKLVPAPVLDLIPRRTLVHIARKFPGNADAAQAELLSLGLEALHKGHTVLRLKQGDPYIYGRGAEEYAFFREKGYVPIVLPGITSALSAPLFAIIPPTHRSVADQVLICTGTGRKGAAPDPPTYIPTQTVVFLMALHRLSSLVDALTGAVPITESGETGTKPKPWPRETPCAVVERASCPDQRVIRSTLQHVCTAVEEEGSRPPGLLIVGWCCEVLKDMKGQANWLVEEGFPGFEAIDFGSDGAAGLVKGMNIDGPSRKEELLHHDKASANGMSDLSVR
ncbi:MAG: hypothetical protein ASARMPREDX12_001894 [Alectoria sarmentosa]|nr:MAG: hypothetical protein ASARMPRED_000250 [Alectoria sarmentosa]CAD6585045.1 MAG: hypothetical protein ASARMPREDX12_001894 [Alectoria sarmentosa]